MLEKSKIFLKIKGRMLRPGDLKDVRNKFKRLQKKSELAAATLKSKFKSDHEVTRCAIYFFMSNTFEEFAMVSLRIIPKAPLITGRVKEKSNTCSSLDVKALNELHQDASELYQLIIEGDISCGERAALISSFERHTKRFSKLLSALKRHEDNTDLYWTFCILRAAFSDAYIHIIQFLW